MGKQCKIIYLHRLLRQGGTVCTPFIRAMHAYFNTGWLLLVGAC